MKCEMCHEKILEGKGHYNTPNGTFCTRCYGLSGSWNWLRMSDTRAQSQKNPDVSECGLDKFPVPGFQRRGVI